MGVTLWFMLTLLVPPVHTLSLNVVRCLHGRATEDSFLTLHAFCLLPGLRWGAHAKGVVVKSELPHL
jgi:hypothetical protein